MARVERGAAHDGPGLRTVVFLKGCPLRCFWCHSPETQSVEPEMLLYRERCIGCGGCIDHCPERAASWADGPVVDRVRCLACGGCLDVCPAGAREVCGQTMTVDELVAELRRDRVFYDHSGGGVTISGGEPLLQPQFVLALLNRCRREGIDTALETCGYGNRTLMQRVALLTDLILFDLKLFDDARHRKATGHGNAGILANLRLLSRLPVKVRVRVPLVPGINDDEANIADIGAFLCDEGLREVEVLPYHRSGLAKYTRIGRRPPLPRTLPPTLAAVNAAVRRLRHFGLSVTAGGQS